MPQDPGARDAIAVDEGAVRRSRLHRGLSGKAEKRGVRGADMWLVQA